METFNVDVSSFPIIKVKKKNRTIILSYEEYKHMSRIVKGYECQRFDTCGRKPVVNSIRETEHDGWRKRRL